MISTGGITEFKEIFTYVPKSVMAQDLGTNNNRMTRLIQHVGQFSINDVYKISSLLEIDFTEVITLIKNQYLNDKQSKKRV